MKLRSMLLVSFCVGVMSGCAAKEESSVKKNTSTEVDTLILISSKEADVQRCLIGVVDPNIPSDIEYFNVKNIKSLATKKIEDPDKSSDKNQTHILIIDGKQIALIGDHQTANFYQSMNRCSQM